MLLTDSIARLSLTAADIPADADIQPDAWNNRYLQNGEIRTWSGPTREVFSPLQVEGSPRRLGTYGLLDASAAVEVLQSAVQAYDNGCGEWPNYSVARRIECMQGFIRRMVERRTEVVKWIMWEIGKARADATKEFDRTVDYIRDTIQALKELDRQSSRFSVEQGVLAQIRRSPLGVVLCMGPYNYPFNETYTTLIPALIMGNTVVMKPPRYGVLLHQPMLEAFRDSFPPGVVNMVTGEGRVVAQSMMETGKVSMLAFIGSLGAAHALRRVHPHPHRLRCVLGLGAKNPGVVMADADLDVAVKECVTGSLSQNGQRCTAIKLIFCHRSIVDGFLERFVKAVEGLKPGLPWSEPVDLTPLPEPDKPDELKALTEDAVAKGASVINPSGGLRSGNFFFPAILYPVDPSMQVYEAEQFGPLVPVRAYDDEEEIVEHARASQYGQQIALFGRDPKRMSRLIDALVHQVSRINLNSQCQRGPDQYPFTGRKDSAEGTLSISDALRVFSIRTLVAAKATDSNQALVTQILTGRHSNFLSTDFIF